MAPLLAFGGAMRARIAALSVSLVVLAGSRLATAQYGLSLNNWSCPVDQIGGPCDSGAAGGVHGGTCIPATCELSVLEPVDGEADVMVPVSSHLCGACVAFTTSYCSDTVPCSDNHLCVDAGTGGLGNGPPANPDEFLVVFPVTFCDPDAFAPSASGPPVVSSDGSSSGPDGNSGQTPDAWVPGSPGVHYGPVEVEAAATAIGGSSPAEPRGPLVDNDLGRGGCTIAQGARPFGGIALLGSVVALWIARRRLRCRAARLDISSHPLLGEGEDLRGVPRDEIDARRVDGDLGDRAT
jgi:hypothetical protein